LTRAKERIDNREEIEAKEDDERERVNVERETRAKKRMSKRE